MFNINKMYYTGIDMNIDNMPFRKSARIKNYDYAQNGAYFVTVCTCDRKPILSQIKNSDRNIPQIINHDIGIEIENSIAYINEHYKTVNIIKYVIMPNHIHMIVLLQSDGLCEDKADKSLQSVIGQFKSFVTKRFNEIRKSKHETLWQRSFYDRVIRDEQEYLEVWRYIDKNPIKWDLDEYRV